MCIGLVRRKCGQNRVVYVEGVFLHVRPVYVDVLILPPYLPDGFLRWMVLGVFY